MNNDTNIRAIRRHEMDAALRLLFCHTENDVAKNVNNKVLVFVKNIESELKATKNELAAVFDANERGRKTWQEAHPDKEMVWPDQAQLVEWLLRENAQLRKDQERLDWLAVSDHWFDEPATESFNPETFRAAIDAARKEAQP